jgi:hypothetical protein
VGDAIARNAWPARIGRDGTLHVNTADSVWAFELAQRATDIAARLEIAAVRFAPGPLAEIVPVEQGESPPRSGPVPSEEELRAAVDIASAIADENLRKSVEKAVSLSLARGRSDRLL